MPHSQITDSLVNLSNAVDGLHCALDGLEKRLVPVLCDQEPVPAAVNTEAKNCSLGSPISGSLRARVDGVERASVRIREMIERLDIESTVETDQPTGR